MSQARDGKWVSDMSVAIGKCAPAVVGAMARSGKQLPDDVDPGAFAGQVMLRIAERACHERWGSDEFHRKAETIIMECIAGGPEDLPTVPASVPRRAGSPEERAEVIKALGRLDTLRLRVLALTLQEGLSVAETATVLGEPEWRIHQELADAVGQIRRQMHATDADRT